VPHGAGQALGQGSDVPAEISRVAGGEGLPNIVELRVDADVLGLHRIPGRRGQALQVTGKGVVGGVHHGEVGPAGKPVRSPWALLLSMMTPVRT